MGLLLLEGCHKSDELWLSAAADRSEWWGRDVGAMIGEAKSGLAVGEITAERFAECQVVIDFSLPTGTRALLEVLDGQALVCGTTGLDSGTEAAIERYASRAAVVKASNFSTGVNVLLGLVRSAAALLPDHDLEIVEMHHNRKRDAPSGTALALAEAAADGRGVDLQSAMVHGREGEVGARPAGEIGMHALRGGDVAGEHTVYLAGSGERLQIGHLATSREAFSDGALRAAKWAASAGPGMHSMRDVLGL